MKELEPRRRIIATTGAGYHPDKVAKMRAVYASLGYDVPPWEGPEPLPVVHSVPAPPRRQPPIENGPGTILKAKLMEWGITESACSCNDLRKKMDAGGPEWCRQEFDGLVAEIVQNAKKHAWMRFAPFKTWTVRRLLEWAIVEAEKAAAVLSPPPIVVTDAAARCWLYTPDGRPVDMRDSFRNASLFMLCGGPSLTTYDPAVFRRRGMLTMAVNNAATVIRPNMWCIVDRQDKFVHQVWMDPAVLKFVPRRVMAEHFNVNDANGNWTRSTDKVGDMPGVFGYHRNCEFKAATFMSEDTFNWGCDDTIADDAGQHGTRSVLLVAIKMAYYLGVRTIYLCGCDWWMADERPYAFQQTVTRGRVAANNHLFRVMRERLARLVPYFEGSGLRVVNVTAGSRLDVFEFMAFDDAVAAATGPFNVPIVTEGRYG